MRQSLKNTSESQKVIHSTQRTNRKQLQLRKISVHTAVLLTQNPLAQNLDLRNYTLGNKTPKETNTPL